MKKIYIRNFFILFFFIKCLFLYVSYYVAFSSEKTVQIMPSLSPMLSKVLPTVVNVYVEGIHHVQRPSFPKDFKYFFNPDNHSNNNYYRPFEGLGSGVIIDNLKRYIITNNHVIRGAEKIRVQLNDGREFVAKIIGNDEHTDLALLQLPDCDNLSSIKIADSDNIKVGDFVIAIGNPFGLGQTVTSGIISALGRSGLKLEGLESFIQTDASINRGNSGGALVNLHGELIGINTAILTPGGGNIGIGFAIPSNIVKNLSQQFIKYGEVKRGQLGIKGTELTADIAKIFNVDVKKGAFVSEVIYGSAAFKSGIRSGDIIISVDDKMINSFSELRVKIGTSMPGKIIKLGVLRNNKPVTILVTLDDGITITTNSEEILIPSLQGAFFRNIIFKKNGNNIQGIKVESVIKNSRAANIGLREGDIIVGVNKEKIYNLSQFRKFLENKPIIMVLNIIRNESTIFLLLR